MGWLQVALSDLRVNVSPDVVELALALQSSVLQPLMQPPPDKCALLVAGRNWSSDPERGGFLVVACSATVVGAALLQRALAAVHGEASAIVSVPHPAPQNPR